MGLLRKLLCVPVTAPFSGALWVTAQLAQAAEAEFYDSVRIRREIEALARAADRGDLDEASYDAEEEVLMARLAEAARRGAP